MSVSLAGSPRPAELRLQAEIRHWRSAAGLVFGALLLGVIQAVIWARVAPGEQVLVAKDGNVYPLATVSSHVYVAIAMYCLLGMVAAAVLVTAAWSLRAVRGLATLLALGLAGGVGALTAYLLGQAMASGVVPTSVGPSSVASLVTAPPASGSAMVLLFEPAVAVVAYTFLVAWNGLPDLGRPTEAISPLPSDRP